MGLFLALPTRGAVKNGTVTALDFSHHGYEDFDEYRLRDGSILTLVFNQLLCHALESRPKTTLFGMLHDDITPAENQWLKKLAERYKACGADILSCVVPIRDDRGLSSTAVFDPESGVMKRLTMKEVDKLPETFDAEMAGYPGWFILPNTGCWVMDFTKQWAEEICFHNSDRIICDEPSEWVDGKCVKGGKWKAQSLSEDWGFGIWAAKRGLKVMATRMHLFHVGDFSYPVAPWGRWDKDEEQGIAFNQMHAQDGVLVPIGNGMVPMGRQMDKHALRQQYLNQMQSLENQIKDLHTSISKCQGAQELCRGFLANIDQLESAEAAEKAAKLAEETTAKLAERNGSPVDGEPVQN